MECWKCKQKAAYLKEKQIQNRQLAKQYAVENAITIATYKTATGWNFGPHSEVIAAGHEIAEVVSKYSSITVIKV